MMQRVITSLMLLASTTVAADELVPRSIDKQPCMQEGLAQFGRYVGDWRISSEQLASDGSAWSAGNGARWIFECIGNGMAVQDHWLPTGGGYGTNLRTYHSDTGEWDIVWAANNQKGLMHISAKINDQDSIVMHTLSPTQEPPRRIIFFAPDAQGWNWVQQMSFDDRQTWTDVFRIRATPWQTD